MRGTSRAAVGSGALRLFVGVPLDEAHQQALARLRARWREVPAPGPQRTGLAWTRPGNWHLTLKFLGDVEPERTPALEAALDAVAFAPFTAQAGGTGCFPPRGAARVVWLGLARGAEEAARLARAVDAACASVGFAPERRPFAAHLTLARVKSGAPGNWTRDWETLEAEVEKMEWPAFTAERFVLWKSVLGPSGPTYTPLRTFPAR
ncbi:MAG: RNA 2',3'-cyclic phosphodiesterase [Desulfovibrionaceae bacterium]|nr:RNA 2',3'-cyclic phosphodiesterase [Desulfovibrionaceae bacterium]